MLRSDLSNIHLLYHRSKLIDFGFYETWFWFGSQSFCFLTFLSNVQICPTPSINNWTWCRAKKVWMGEVAFYIKSRFKEKFSFMSQLVLPAFDLEGDGSCWQLVEQVLEIEPEVVPWGLGKDWKSLCGK